jgi:hypothetical protein
MLVEGQAVASVVPPAAVELATVARVVGAAAQLGAGRPALTASTLSTPEPVAVVNVMPVTVVLVLAAGMVSFTWSRKGAVLLAV